MSRKNFKDLTGQRFGRLIVISRAPNNKYGSSQWNCICDCGQTTIVMGARLLCGGTSSCGCLGNEIHSKTASKPFNDYYIKDHIVYIKLSDNVYCTIDEEDLELIKPFRWTYSGTKHYATAYNKQQQANTKSMTIKMHRLIMNCFDPSLSVDHIDRNTLNNCKSNLRICTQQDNLKNRSVYKNNTSGRVGVYKRNNRWLAAISVNGKMKKLGYFTSIEEASAAYEEAACLYYGEFARKKEGGKE